MSVNFKIKKKNKEILIHHIDFVMDAILTNDVSVISFERYKSEFNNTLTVIHGLNIKLSKELQEKVRKCQLQIIQTENKIYLIRKSRIMSIKKKVGSVE